MGQLNIHMSPGFEQKLKRYMQVRQIKTKSDAVRTAVDEALQLAKKAPTVNLRDLYGAGKKLRQRPRKSWLKDNDLWGEDGH
jgi:hypothetical protein